LTTSSTQQHFYFEVHLVSSQLHSCRLSILRASTDMRSVLMQITSPVSPQTTFTSFIKFSINQPFHLPTSSLITTSNIFTISPSSIIYHLNSSFTFDRGARHCWSLDQFCDTTCRSQVSAASTPTLQELSPQAMLEDRASLYVAYRLCSFSYFSSWRLQLRTIEHRSRVLARCRLI
jgi:hypothetical protein